MKKQLGLGSVYAIATGATLSAGLFLLPGLAAQQAGPAVVLCYLLAAVPLIPAMLCIVELSTAMPRAGGSYYFLERSLGPMLGTIGGFGTWLAIALKTSFALVGLAATVALLFEPRPWLLKSLAVGFAVIFAALNAMGARHSGRLQKILVIWLLTILVMFLVTGLPEVQIEHFNGFFDAGHESILATAGLVYISYVGVTNVASVSEEVSNPERNLPWGLFLSLFTALLIYALATTVMVGVLPAAQLAGNMTPMSTAAEVI
ncbi:MAG: APC family permease, partial [bacterium]